MYYIAYDRGAKITEGETTTTEAALAAVPGQWHASGALGDERKYTDPTQPGIAVYVRPERKGINV